MTGSAAHLRKPSAWFLTALLLVAAVGLTLGLSLRSAKHERDAWTAAVNRRGVQTYTLSRVFQESSGIAAAFMDRLTGGKLIAVVTDDIDCQAVLELAETAPEGLFLVAGPNLSDESRRQLAARYPEATVTTIDGLFQASAERTVAGP